MSKAYLCNRNKLRLGREGGRNVCGFTVFVVLIFRSSKYIHPLYQQWEGLGPELEEEDVETKQLDRDEVSVNIFLWSVTERYSWCSW